MCLADDMTTGCSTLDGRFILLLLCANPPRDTEGLPKPAATAEGVSSAGGAPAVREEPPLRRSCETELEEVLPSPLLLLGARGDFSPASPSPSTPPPPSSPSSLSPSSPV